MSALIEQLLVVGVAPMLEPLGFERKGLQLIRKVPEATHSISFVAEDPKAERIKFYVELGFASAGEAPASVRLAALMGKRDGWWVIQEESDAKQLSEQILVGLLNVGLPWFVG